MSNPLRDEDPSSKTVGGVPKLTYGQTDRRTSDRTVSRRETLPQFTTKFKQQFTTYFNQFRVHRVVLSSSKEISGNDQVLPGAVRKPQLSISPLDDATTSNIIK